MSYTFTNKPFVWEKSGADPTQYESKLGLQGGMALPASFVNQQWTKTYRAISEIQTAIENGSIGFSDDATIGNSITVGDGHTGSGTYYALFGAKNTAKDYNTVVGKSSKTPTASGASVNTGDLFVVGNGTDGSAKSNALRVTAAGDVMGVKAYSATGADYAELFEWADGNPDNEDRRGLFVTLEGEKIRLANANDDYIVGVVSATPSIIGDACTDDWVGKYETDVFGARVLENGAYKLTEGFDSEKDSNYTSRLERPEWAAVGLIGKLIVVDDGTCKVNKYCYPSKSGVATNSETGYRVLSRIDETHVKILFR